MMKNFSRLRINRGLTSFAPGRWAGVLLAVLCLLFPAVSNAMATSFPLKASANGHYLVDQQGVPFLVMGDTAWALVTQSTQADRKLYLDNRQAKGFNALLISLVQHGRRKTLSGLAPFLKRGDFSTPNPAYFNYAHQVIRQANDHGMVVFVNVADLGFEGRDWYKESLRNGRQKTHDFGVYVGNKFKDLNVVWVVAGDYIPPVATRWTVTALAKGIHEADPKHLITAENSRGISASKIYNDQSWLTLDGGYTGAGPGWLDPLYASYNRHPTRPIVVLEQYYEGEKRSRADIHGPWDIRRQAYGIILAGTSGQIYGNHAIYAFEGRRPNAWKKALNSTGAQDMARLYDFFKALAWYQLVPDQTHALVTSGYGTGEGMITGGETADKTLAVIYIPSLGAKARKFTVDMSQFSGAVTAQWYDPSNGSYTSAASGTLPNSGGSHTFDTPGVNSGGAGDWVLLLQVHA